MAGGPVTLPRRSLFPLALLPVAPARPEPTVRPVNPIIAENRLPGTADWRLSRPATAREIEGYASATSVAAGEELALYVSTDAPRYTVELFRMGWYQGLGARRVLGPVVAQGRRQATPEPDPATGLVDCAWTDPLRIQTAPDWASGVYLARLTEEEQGKQSYIILVVRDDRRAADLLVQLPVTTYQAYNFWGGTSLYGWGSGREEPWGGSPGRPATKVSFNRPYAGSTDPAAASGLGAGEFLTNVQPVAQGFPISSAGWDYNFVRWVEKEGYDAAYVTNLDLHASPALLARARGFLSIGHDEYWSWEMRRGAEVLRERGVNLGFFSANTAYWQVRLESSPATRAPGRVLVCYKSRLLDPWAADERLRRRATVRWREGPVRMPEDALLGVGYRLAPVQGDIVISDPGHWALAGTGLEAGSRLPGLLGYEVDGLRGNAPAGIQVLATSPARSMSRTPRTATSHATSYVWPSGATVFAAGTIQWSWGLDDFNAPDLRPSRLSPAAQQITRNVLDRLARREAG